METACNYAAEEGKIRGKVIILAEGGALECNTYIYTCILKPINGCYLPAMSY